MFNLILTDIGGWLGIMLFLLLQCGVHFCFAVSSREKCLPVMRYVLQAIALIIILLYFTFLSKQWISILHLLYCTIFVD